MTDCINIIVIFPDKSIKLYPIESRQTVVSFKRIVSNSMDINEDKYFGFYAQDDQKNNYWLSDEKVVLHYDFMKLNTRPRLFFALKHFYHFDYWLADEMTKLLFYHQLKQQLYDGDIECGSDRCFKLLAMTLLLDAEKFKSAQDIQKMNIISANLFEKHPSIDYCIHQIMSRYKDLERIPKDELMTRFVADILEIPFQLTHFFYAKNFNTSTVIISVNNLGFFESDKSNKLTVKSTYSWAEITNISFHKSRVNIDILDLKHRSSLRRKSSALSISYELYNCNLAKSLVYLAKDIFNFISQTVEKKGDSSDLQSTPYTVTMRVMSSTTPRRNPNNIKKILNNTYSGKLEKIRPSAQNTFIPENEIMMSRSSSRISLSSSNYAGSAITNDSNSSQMDEESLNTPVNVPEKQKMFIVLNEKRKTLKEKLNKLIKEAVQNCLSEHNITRSMPRDIQKLDPKQQIKLTNFALKTQLDIGEVSTYQKRKISIMEEIETLQNIVDKLKENERKHRGEIKKKTEEIQNCVKRMQALEKENALEIHLMNNSNRSNSEGCIFSLQNGNVPTINGHLSPQIEVVPMTEPRSRKNHNIFSEHSSSGSDTVKSYNENYPRIKTPEANFINKPTSLIVPPCRPSDVKNASYNTQINQSQFRRFTTTRSQIPRLPSKQKINFIQRKTPFTNSSNSNSSVDSNCSIDATDANCPVSSHSNTDSENSDDQVIPRRTTQNLNENTNQNARDSLEINQHRSNLHFKVSNMKIMSRNNKSSSVNNPNRHSVSLEDLREDCSESSETPSITTHQRHKESFESLNSAVHKLTYHPSKKDSPTHLTRGRQPSIIRKAARR